MFTPELERQRASKIAQTKQYYEDLRAQIAEKNRKTDSPTNFVTNNQTILTPGVINARRMQALEQQNSNYNSPHASEYGAYSDRSNNSYNQNLVVPYSNENGNRNYLASTPLIPDFPKTSIAPLNLAITNFQLDTMPDLPRQMNHPNSIDPDTFNDRLRSLRAQIDEQKNDYIHASESQDRLRSHIFPEMQQLINEVDNLLEKTVSAKIPMHLKNINDMTGRNMEILGSSDSHFSSLANIIRDGMSEKQNQIHSFQSKLAEFVDSSSNGILDVKADAGRQRDMLDLVQQKLSKLEKKDTSTIEGLSHCNTEFEVIDNDATSKFSSLQRDINTCIQSVSQQLSQQIKQESEVRVAVESQLHGQAEEINTNAASFITKLQSAISELASAFKTSLDDLSTSISGAIQQTQQETEDRTADLSTKIDGVITDTETTMQVMSNEIVSTITQIKDSFAAERNTIETAMQTENTSRAKNHEIIKDKFQHLKNIIAREQDIQMNKIEEMMRDLTKNVTEYMKKAMLPINVDLEYIKAKKIEMDRVESMVESLEKNLSTARNQCFESIASLQRSLDNISGSINETKISLNTKIEELDTDLKSIESCNKSDLAMKTDIQKMQEGLNNDTEDRIKFLEQQIVVVLSNLSELTKGADEQPEPIVQPGTAMLQQLVDKGIDENKQSDVEFPIVKPSGLPNVEEEDETEPKTKRKHHKKHHHKRKHEKNKENNEAEEDDKENDEDDKEKESNDAEEEKNEENENNEDDKDRNENKESDEDDKDDKENHESDEDNKENNDAEEDNKENNEVEEDNNENKENEAEEDKNESNENKQTVDA